MPREETHGRTWVDAMLTKLHVEKTVPIPGHVGQTATIKRIGWKALERAGQETMSRAIAVMREHDLQWLHEQLQQHGGEAAVRDADQFYRHDPLTLVSSGLIAWSLPQPIDLENIQALGELTIRALAREVWDLSNRSHAHG